MKITIYILYLIFFFFYSFVYCQNYVEYINKIQKYKENIKIKYSKETQIRYIDTTTFNINEYMQMFDLLKFKDTTKNYCFYYFYIDYQCSAYPRIIVKEKDINFQNNLYILNRGEKIDFNYQLYKTLAKDFLIPENSYMGYLQYLYFYELGNKFLFYGYASHQDKSIITSKKEKKKAIRKLYKQNFSIYDKSKEFDNIDFAPKVNFTEDNEYCEIEWVEKRYEGIYKCRYKISRTDFNINKTFEKKLLKIRANFMAQYCI
jgi:hypothetical protein